MTHAVKIQYENRVRRGTVRHFYSIFVPDFPYIFVIQKRIDKLQLSYANIRTYFTVDL